MWSSSDDGEGEHFITTSNKGRLPSTSSAPLSNPTRKIMEDVWKDINLPSLTDHRCSSSTTTTTTTTTTFTTSSTATGSSVGGITFQDFLGRPFINDSSSNEATTFTVSPPSLLPKPSIALSLSSMPEFHFLNNIDPLRPPPQFQNHVNAPSSFFMSSLASSSPPLEALACSPSFSPFCNKRRVSDSDDGPRHGRHERMIKNRESAARSRARKQAYTNELEIEIGHLKKEIAKLRQEQEHQRQHQQRLSLLERTDQLPKKHKLRRTSTAPF